MLKKIEAIGELLSNIIRIKTVLFVTLLKLKSAFQNLVFNENAQFDTYKLHSLF